MLDSKFEIENKIKSLKGEQQIKLGYSIDKKDLYKKAKEGKNLQQEYQDQIKLLDGRINDLKIKEVEYLNSINKYSDEAELQAFLPKMIDEIREELELIISKSDLLSKSENFNNTQINYISDKIFKYFSLKKYNELDGNEVATELLDFIKSAQDNNEQNNDFSYFSDDEISAIRLLLNHTSINNFNYLFQTKQSLQNELKHLPLLRADLAEAKSHLSSDDNSIISSYDENESVLNDLKSSIANLDSEIERINREIARYDISEEEIPNPKLDILKKIEPIFNQISNALLKAKKQRIEDTMKEDLNSNLVAYSDQIGKVELSEDLSDLTFKIYHKSGNEIYLEQLNAASKQIIVQVLLKALHQFGDYNPPVMIDTVMGYLDEDSRASLLENYFPKLSHQTILLSTDSEIRTDKDLKKIEEFISKKYTLVRDKENQYTIVQEGYFNA